MRMELWSILFSATLTCATNLIVHDDEECMDTDGGRCRWFPDIPCASYRDRKLVKLPKWIRFNTTILDLGHNAIMSINKNSFNHLINLEVLFVDSNLISSIAKGSFKTLRTLRRLDLENNRLTALEQGTFDYLEKLTYLNLSNNRITKIEEDVFRPLESLEELNLRNNWITSIANPEFGSLQSLQRLLLARNKIVSVESGTFHGLGNLFLLDLGSNEIALLKPGTFDGLESLKVLYLDDNNLTSIEPGLFCELRSLQDLGLNANKINSVRTRTFDGLRKLAHLRLGENKISSIDAEAFGSLESLEYLFIEENPVEVIAPLSFLSSSKQLTVVCCIVRTFNISCSISAESLFHIHVLRAFEYYDDPFSSCDSLMHQSVLRYSIWILGTLAVGFNLCVLLWRSVTRHKVPTQTIRNHRVSNILASSLALGDLLMGVFLLIIASIDTHFRGYYVLQDEKWRRSKLCSLAGFLCAFSSEFSVFILTILTIERYLTITYPTGTFSLTATRIRILVCLCFGLALLLAGLPLAPNIDYFKDFYGQSSVCLALPLSYSSANSSSSTSTTSWGYSFFVFVVLNSVSMFIVTVCYVKIVLAFRRSARDVKMATPENAESLLRQRIVLLVGTDMACWLPVIGLSLANLSGWDLPPTVYAWIAVFVLPINSAINPIIYTFYTGAFRKVLQKKWASVRNMYRHVSKLSQGFSSTRSHQSSETCQQKTEETRISV